MAMPPATTATILVVVDNKRKKKNANENDPRARTVQTVKIVMVKFAQDIFPISQSSLDVRERPARDA